MGESVGVQVDHEVGTGTNIFGHGATYLSNGMHIDCGQGGVDKAVFLGKTMVEEAAAAADPQGMS